MEKVLKYGYQDKGGDKIKKITILILIVLISSTAIVHAVEEYPDATCTPFSVFWYSGYSCMEKSGGVRTFMNPGSYDAMNSYYTPTLEEVFVPQTTYLYVTGKTSSTYSGLE